MANCFYYNKSIRIIYSRVRDKNERLDKKSKLLSNVHFIIPVDINLVLLLSASITSIILSIIYSFYGPY